MTLLSTCPMCHEDLPDSVDNDLIEAKAFCPWCDYPLFWTVSPPETPPPSLETSAATPTTQVAEDERGWFRQPGVGGKELNTGDDCWHCDEPNDQDATECRRCHVPIPEPDPRPAPPRPAAPGIASPAAVPKRNPEVPAWLLVALGIVLIVLTAAFVVIS